MELSPGSSGPLFIRHVLRVQANLNGQNTLIRKLYREALPSAAPSALEGTSSHKNPFYRSPANAKYPIAATVIGMP